MSYTAAIRAHEGGGGGGSAQSQGAKDDPVTAARGLLGRLKARGLAPDGPLYNALLRVCAQGGQWRVAGDVLREMAWEAGIGPDEWTVRALTGAVASAGGGGGGGPKAKERGQTLAFLRRLQEEGKKRSLSPSRRTAVARVGGGSGGGR